MGIMNDLLKIEQQRNIDVKNDYKNLIKILQDYYKSQCRLNLIDYVPLFTDDSLDKGLNEYFNKRQKLG